MLADDLLNFGKIAKCSVAMKPLLELDATFVAQRLQLMSRSVIEMQVLAEKFAFEKNPAELVRYIKSISGGTLSDNVVLESAKLPASPAWLEMPIMMDNRDGTVHRGRAGYMVESSDKGDGTVVVVVVTQHDDRPPLVIGSLSIQMPVKIGVSSFKVHSWHSHVGLPGTMPSKQDQDDCQHYVLDFLEACFLLQMPRLTETRYVKHDEKLQRSRAKKGKPPFLEYRKVRMLVDVPKVQYVREGEPHVAGQQTNRELGVGGGGHKKYHRVLPHARTYKDEDGKVRDVVPIPQHWRGDPKLGIVIHEKTIGTRGEMK